MDIKYGDSLTRLTDVMFFQSAFGRLPHRVVGHVYVDTLLVGAGRLTAVELAVLYVDTCSQMYIVLFGKL